MYMYTKKGQYHECEKEVCGDVVRGLDNGEFTVLALADGVSGCKYGADGAGIASSCAVDYLCRQYMNLHILPKEWPVYLMNLIKKTLMEAANNDKSRFIEYSSTLIVILIDYRKQVMYYCNIGDSILLTIDKSKCQIVCMPQGMNSECPVITTEGIECGIVSGVLNISDVNSIMLCSDGMWRMMYNQTIMKPEIKELLFKENYRDFKQFINASNNIDDCSFALAEIRRCA